MFIFAVLVLPPMYEVLCDLTGLNGKVSLKQFDIGARSGDTAERMITVQFVADVDPKADWAFKPKTRSMKVFIGQTHQTSFFVRNPNREAVITQAIPSVSPAQATLYLKKAQCFCFEQQQLAAGEAKEMGLIFYVDPDIPEHLTTITLAYRLYDITDRMKPSIAETGESEHV